MTCNMIRLGFGCQAKKLGDADRSRRGEAVRRTASPFTTSPFRARHESHEWAAGLAVSRSSLLTHPEHRLSDREVADDLIHFRVRVEPAPQTEIVGSREGQARKEQAGLAHRPLIEVLDVRRQGPTLFVRDER